MADYQLGVIGGGNMGEALVRGIINNSPRVLPRHIVVSDPVPQRRGLFDSIGVKATADNRVPAACPCVVLAVKPQTMAEVLPKIKDAVRPDALVITIAAGITTSNIDAALGGAGRIIRVMPNTPLLVGAGMSAITAGPRATETDLAQTEEFFGFRGKTVRVTEEMMDAVTAVSGSGPAYFFYLIEAMVEAGVAEGLSPADATLLAGQTCAGAAELLAKTQESPEVLRKRVTSPGGTTERAVSILNKAGVGAALIKAIRAAAARSRELGQ